MKQHPSIRELLVSEDGKIYDQVAGHYLNVNTNSSGTREAVAYWYTGGKKYTLDVLKLIYETYVQGSQLKKDYKVVFKSGTTIHASNLKKTRKGQRLYTVVKEEGYESWLQDDIYC